MLQHSGVPADDAALAARALIRTSLRGIDTHGIARLPGYVDKLRAGEVNARPVPRFADRHGLQVCLGDGGLGQVVLARSLQHVLALSSQASVVACSIEDCGHLGALGVLLLPVAEAGCMALLCQRTPPIMALPGAKAPAIGNNPLAFVAPVAGQAPLVFDMALSTVARGRVADAAREGTAAIPLDWALDASGQPTDDPVAALAGAMQPVAGYKGLGLATLVECLAGSLRSSPAVQAGLSGSAQHTSGSAGSASGASAFLLVIHPALAVGRALFDAHMRAWVDHFLQAGGAQARYPGQRQHACEQERLAQGIPVPHALLQKLQALGLETGNALPAAFRGA